MRKIITDCRHRDAGRSRGYVGSLQVNRRLQYKERIVKVSELARQIEPSLRKPLCEGQKAQWYFTCTLHIPDIGHKVRVVLLWPSREATSPRIALVSNRVQWEVSRIVRVYRDRWTGMETFHRDGKQELGLGDCQLRSRECQARHMHLVMLAYSLLMSQLEQGHAYDWAYRKLSTIGEACRSILTETLRDTLHWAFERVQRYGWDQERVVAHLGLAGNG